MKQTMVTSINPPGVQEIISILRLEGDELALRLADWLEIEVNSYRCEKCGIHTNDPGVGLAGDGLYFYCPACAPDVVKPRKVEYQ